MVAVSLRSGVLLLVVLVAMRGVFAAVTYLQNGIYGENGILTNISHRRTDDDEAAHPVAGHDARSVFAEIPEFIQRLIFALAGRH